MIAQHKHHQHQQMVGPHQQQVPQMSGPPPPPPPQQQQVDYGASSSNGYQQQQDEYQLIDQPSGYQPAASLNYQHQQYEQQPPQANANQQVPPPHQQQQQHQQYNSGYQQDQQQQQAYQHQELPVMRPAMRQQQMSPAYQQQQPVRGGPGRPFGPPVSKPPARELYQPQAQVAPSQANFGEQAPASAHWRPQQYQTTSSPPTLLQQQLNGRPHQPQLQHQQPLQHPPRASTMPKQQAMQQQQVPRPQMMRYDQAQDADYQQQELIGKAAPGRPTGPSATTSAGAYYPTQGTQTGPQAARRLAQPVQQRNPRMLPGAQEPPLMQPPPHLLGNPTPPLTPNSGQQQPQQLLSGRPASDQQHWPPHNQHHQAVPLAPPTDQVQAPPPPPPAGFQPVGSSQQPIKHHHHHLSHPHSHQHQHPHQHPHQHSHSHQHPHPPLHQHHPQQHPHATPTPPETSTSNGQARIMPKNVTNSFHHHHQVSHQHQPQQQLPYLQHNNINNSSHQPNLDHQLVEVNQTPPQQRFHRSQQMATLTPTTGFTTTSETLVRLTLPLRETPLLGPFRFDQHEQQFNSKVFHLKQQLFNTLSKSMNLINPQTAAVTQELQFRAYLVKSSNNHHHPHHHHHHHHQHQDSLLANNTPTMQQRTCQWPEQFQVSVNQNLVPLDRSNSKAHKAADIFQFCQMGENLLEIQANDCYCSHEFVLEAVDRPTLKAFMNSCFKSRLLPVEGCLQKIKSNFGSPGFLLQNHQLQQSMGIFNDYISEFAQGCEVTKARISMRCPITGRRMRTPTRGHNCKHLQCFDLENFLYLNRERSRWNCPICLLEIPFNMLELDQHQINIVQALAEMIPAAGTDEILIDQMGQWHSFHGSPPPPPPPPPPQQPLPQHLVNQQPMVQQQQPTTTTAKSTGTYHPQPPMSMTASHQQQQMVGSPVTQPMRPMSGPMIGSPAPTSARQHQSGSPAQQQLHWQDGNQAPNQQLTTSHSASNLMSGQSSMGPSVPVRRPASAMSQPMTAGSRLPPQTKKAYSGQFVGQQQQPQSASLGPFASFSLGEPSGSSSQFVSAPDTDDLSPLAAMERTIVQHEQQMGPPPFDPNNLTSSSPMRPNQSAANSQSSLMAPNQNQQQTETSRNAASQNPAYSPAHGNTSSPRMAPVGAISSPQQQQQAPARPSDLPQSPQQQHQGQLNASISMPATPSSVTASAGTSAMMVHGGPETPATPSNQQQQQLCAGPLIHSSANANGSGSTSSSAPIVNNNSNSNGVDHQPLSNGSASAGSITSTFTMTPSGQSSLGSVGMGGDAGSRCGTAPLQETRSNSLGLDDLMLPGGSQQSASNSATAANYKSHLVDEKSEILMGKLMMDSHDTLLRDTHNGELAMALEEAEWKQQLDRGKSEHLANFLNEPLMKKQQQQHYQQQQQQLLLQPNNNNEANKMLSGGLNPSDDEDQVNHSHGSSPNGHNLDQLEYSSYLDADDHDAGLPPDDSILDLFER